MINLISSDCLGGRYFQKNKSEFKNPFIWSSFFLSDFIYLIKNWEDINFEKIGLEFTDNEYGTFTHTPTIIIDNAIKLYFHHHFQNKKYLTPTKIHKNIDDIDLGYYDILGYLNEKYNNRLKRMSKEEPVFIYNDKKIASDLSPLEFIKLDTPYKKILVTTKKEYKKYSSNSLDVYIKPRDIMNSSILCDDLFKSGILK